MADETSNVERVDDEQTPLLPSANQAARRKPSTRRLENNRRTCRMLICIIFILFFVFICLPLLTSLIYEIWPCHWWPKEPWQCPYEPEPQRPEPIPPPLIPPPTCPDPQFTQTFEFDFQNHGDFNLEEAILIPNVRSKVHVVGGDHDQSSTIVARVQVNATSANDISRIRVSQDHSRHRLSIASVDAEYFNATNVPPAFEGCGVVLITVSIRPSAHFYGSLKLHTKRANIELGHNLNFRSAAASLTSLYGDIACLEAYDHYRMYSPKMGSLQVSTQHNGSIFGRWPISTNTDLHTVNGDVKVNLVAEYWSGYPEPTNLNITSTNGDVDVHLSSTRSSPYRSGISVRTYNTSITTDTGDITGHMHRGAETTLITRFGLIDVNLTPDDPYGNLKSKITTKSPRGSTNVRVLDPLCADYPYDVDQAMDQTKSLHEAGTEDSGSLWLTYPLAWTGHLNGSVEDGTIALRGTFDEEWEVQNVNSSANGFAKVANGTIERHRGDGKSELRFKVGKGNAVVDVGTYNT